MSFSSLSEFIHMDGHGIYVWVSYATALLVIAYNIIMPRTMRKRFVVEQARQQRREEQNASHS